MQPTAQLNLITHKAQVDAAHAQAIANQLQQLGHITSPQEVIPATSDTPITKSVEMEQVGAQVVGDDLSHFVESTIGGFTTGSGTTRVTNSNRFLSTLWQKLQKRKAPGQEVVFK